MSDFEKIWLQTTDEHGEATWCQNKINDDDVEYIRVDLNKERQGTKEISVLYEQSQVENATLKRENEAWRQAGEDAIKQLGTIVGLMSITALLTAEESE